MIKVFIESNISQALEYLKSNSIANIYFVIPDNAMGVRYEKAIEDFNFLKSIKEEAKFIKRSEVKDYIKEGDIFFGANAFEERVAYLKASFQTQNRLFDDFNYESIKSFTPFKLKAEKCLPKKFTDNIFQYEDQEVLNCLSYYFDENHLAKTYFDTRNGVLGRDYSTKFSRYLSNGRLNVRYLYNYLKDYEERFGSNKSTYWIQFELLWREFFYWSYQKNKELIFSLNGLKGRPEFKDVYLEEFDFSENDLMKSVLRELTETGFVSNRLRQVFASEWINSYELDWRDGANLFEKYLVDYDVYSNWGNWQYLAGVGHDPRGKRKFNVLKQLDTYDPQREYFKKWLI